MKRTIVRIDEEKCDGCGKCVPGCAEGALKIVGGKAKLVKDSYCDGLGACLGACPQGAITMEEREADPFSLEEVTRGAHQGCPGSAVRTPRADQEHGAVQWPLQLRLIPVNAPFLRNADLLVAAHCAPPAFPSFHQSLLAGRRLIIACPKLDDTSGYLEKLTDIFRLNEPASVTVAFMEVPCCSGLVRLVQQALERSGKSIPLSLVKIGVDGRLK